MCPYSCERCKRHYFVNKLMNIDPIPLIEDLNWLYNVSSICVSSDLLGYCDFQILAFEPNTTIHWNLMNMILL